jgi:hypothetical protein
VVESADHGPVVVDDAVDDRVERRGWPEPKQLRPRLEPEPHLVQPRLAVANGHDEPVPDEDLDLAELDLVALLLVRRRLQHNEQRIAVDLDLRSLMRLDRVLDRQLVEAELAPHGVELLRRRRMEADPGEDIGDATAFVGLFEVDLAGTADAVFVQGHVDDHGGIMERGPPLGWRKP